MRIINLIIYCLLKRSRVEVLAEENLKFLFKVIHELLKSFSADSSELCNISPCLKFVLIVLTGSDNLNENKLVEYLMTENIFEPLIRMVHLHRINGEETNSYDIVMIIILLCNYRKNQSTNPYIVQLSILADELILNSFSSIINGRLINFSRNYSSGKGNFSRFQSLNI